MQIKTTIRYHLTHVRMVILFKRQVSARMWRKENPQALLMGMLNGAIIMGMLNGAVIMGNSREILQKIKNRTTI